MVSQFKKSKCLGLARKNTCLDLSQSPTLIVCSIPFILDLNVKLVDYLGVLYKGEVRACRESNDEVSVSNDVCIIYDLNAQ